MKIATEPAPTAPVIQPSVEKYGTIILQSGFTQHPRSVEDFLNTQPLCAMEKSLVLALEFFRREAGQEVYPSVRTLAERCTCSERRVRQMTAKLTGLGLLRKLPRFAERSQVANTYSLEPLYEKVAAWLDPQIASALEEQEAELDQPFEPRDIIDESAQIIVEEFGESEPAEVRQCAQRLRLRWDKVAQLGDWEMFSDLVQRAAEQTEVRKNELTRSGLTFAQLVPYFFSALDYAIICLRNRAQYQANPRPRETREQRAERSPEASQVQEMTSVQQAEVQAEEKPGMAELRRRQAERKASESRVRIRASRELQLRVEAIALTFHDEQVKSSVQRAANLLADARVSEATFFSLLQTARDSASQRQVHKKNGQSFNRIPYFFTLLEEEVRKVLLDQIP